MEASPSTVYFSGYALDTTTSITITILNKGHRAIRVKTRLLQDTNDGEEIPSFRLEASPTGAIPPGLAMKVIVYFLAKDYSLASSILEVESENSALVVPIYAFPLKSSFTVPKSIAFGNIPISETVTKVYDHRQGVCLTYS